MRRVLLVDWLGRGGIAQTSESWALELASAGADVRVVTRLGRELGAGAVPVVGPPERRNAILSHAALCRFAAREIRAWVPDVVVLQNYVIPALEERVHRAARRVGAEIVLVVHDNRHHEWREGGHLGLERQLHRADHLVVHSAAVGSSLSSPRARLLPLPVQLGLVDLDGPSPVHQRADRLLALQVGVLNRVYKGTGTALALATDGVDGWVFGFAGVGAPVCPGAQTVDRFLEPVELVAAVRAADAVLLPYRHATQSGAVVLAQMCRTVPVASAVGGLAEQIEDGVTGLLVPAGAGVGDWRERLERLEDDDLRTALACQAQESVWRRHEAFRSGIRELAGLSVPQR